MLTRIFLRLHELRTAVVTATRRNIGISAVVVQKTADIDPIQKLFVEKIKEYDRKSKGAPGKFVDSTPDLEKELQDELTKIKRKYSPGKPDADLTEFPSFNFTEPEIDSINLEQHK